MTEYEFLECVIVKLGASGANFSDEVLDRLTEELKQAREDGRLDEDRDYAPDAVMYCDFGLSSPIEKRG